jgi:hypothetical protein
MHELRYHLYPSSRLHAPPYGVEVIVTQVGLADAIVCGRACRYEAFPRYPPGLLVEVNRETAARHATLPDPAELARLFDRHRSG